MNCGVCEAKGAAYCVKCVNEGSPLAFCAKCGRDHCEKKHPGMPLDKAFHDMVNSPPHYTSHPSGIEPIVITRHMNFNLGNVIKYVMRAPYKGHELQDLEKAAWYLQDEIARLKGEHDG